MCLNKAPHAMRIILHQTYMACVTETRRERRRGKETDRERGEGGRGETDRQKQTDRQSLEGREGRDRVWEGGRGETDRVWEVGRGETEFGR